MSMELLDFLNASVTPYHAVAGVCGRLKENGFEELQEGSPWDLKEGGKYYTVRNGSSMIAFVIPTRNYTGFMIAASHSDSPAFRIKENPEIIADGYTRLNVEGYGSMLYAPWFDRPLSIAGRIVVREDTRLITKLVNIDRDLLMIPSLAIHMDRNINEKHELNPQKELCPILGDEKEKGVLMRLIAAEADVKAEDILGYDLYLYVRDKATVWGADREFIAAPHIDDLQCTFGDMIALLEAEPKESIPVMAVFDNEEVGSRTKQGAFSTFLEDTLNRIHIACGKSEEEKRTCIASSFMVSADNAHALHPSYTEKADPANRPLMNKGIVLKYSSYQKYATDAVSAAVFKEICERADVPYQVFTNRSDMISGSTLGNISTVHVSLNTVDIGLPQLAMHSPYETAGVKDTDYLIKAMKVYFSGSLKQDGPGQYTLK